MTNIRLTRRITTDLAIWMGLFGIATGLAFPFFAVLIGVDASTALSPEFFASTVAAGILVGGMNFAIARTIIIPRLRALARSMSHVSESLHAAQFHDDWARCNADQCRVSVDSEDAIGALSRAFNQLITTLLRVQTSDEKLRHFSRSITSHLGVEGLSNTCIDFLLTQIGASGAALFVETSGELRLVAAHGLTNPQGLSKNPRLLRTLTGGETIQIRLPDDLILDGVLAQFRPREVLLTPLRFHDQSLGVLLTASTEPMDPDTLGLLSLISNVLGLSLNNAIAHDQLERIAALDPLTGVYNRRFGLQRLDEEISRVLRGNTPLALIMFDIDHFKRVNDTYGHLAGDRVIRSLTRTATAAVRKGDVLVRYGGEEFLAIMPGASLADAREIAERIRHMSQESVCHEQDHEIRFTVSLGYASFPEQRMESAEDLLRCADQALYRAKEGGRNQAIAAPSLAVTVQSNPNGSSAD